MKQKFILLILLIGGITASCRDDPGESSEIKDDPTPETEITLGALNAGLNSSDLPEGYRITKINIDGSKEEYLFHYDENGNLLDFLHDGDVWTIGGSPLTMKTTGDYWSETYKFTTNSKGYVTKVEYEFRDDEYWESGKATHNFSYNSNDQIEEISSLGTWYENEKVNLQFEAEFKFTYSSTVLQKIEEKLKYIDDIEDHDKKYIWTFNYRNGIENKYYQYTPDMLSIFMGDDFYTSCEAAAYLGLFGKASSMLPSQHKREDGATYDYTYTTNSYGAIVREGNWNEFTYAIIGRNTRAAQDNFVTNNTKEKHTPHVRHSKARKERFMMLRK